MYLVHINPWYAVSTPTGLEINMFGYKKRIAELEQQVKQTKSDLRDLRSLFRMHETLERMERDGSAEKIRNFNDEVSRILKENSECDKMFEFTCPACGGKAYTYRAALNGHVHAECSQCKIGFHQ